MDEENKNGFNGENADDGFFDDRETPPAEDDGFFDDQPQKTEPTRESRDGNQSENPRQRVPVPASKTRNKGKLIGTIFLSIGIAVAVFFCGMATTWFCLDDEIRTLINIKKTIDREYYQDISDDEFYGVLFDAINEDLLDPYSEYMTYDEYVAMTKDLAGSRSGIGVVFIVKGENGDSQMMVYRVVENSPAEAAGLKYGDLVIGFGNSETDVTDSVDFDNGLKPFLESKADGEEFYLKIKRGDETTLVQIAKEAYVENYVSYRTNKSAYGFTGDEALTYTQKGTPLTCLPDDTAYIKLSQFTGNAAGGFNRVMEQFKADGMKNLVLDLRENGGGYLAYAQEIAKYFCKDSTKKNPVIVVADYGEKKESYRATGNAYYDYFSEDSRIMVLADNGTASASECLIGAMLDYGAIGYDDICLSWRGDEAKTYGKGIMQMTFYVDVKKSDFIKLTTAELRWPVSGTSIHARGILPEDGTLTVSENHTGDVEIENAVGLFFP